MTNEEVKNVFDGFYNTYGSLTKYWNKNYSEEQLSSSDWGLTDQKCAAGNCTSNTFGNAIQCYGFSLFLAYLVFGTRLSVGEINSTNDGCVVKDRWVIHRSNLTSLTLEPGDIVRTGVSDSYGHSAIIRQVNSNGTFKVAECWGGDTYGCKLAWNNYNGDATTYPNASALLGAARWVLKAPKDNSLTHPTSMNTYKITNVGASKCLNIYGDGLVSLYNGINVTLWSDSDTNEHKWVVSDLGNSVYIKSAIDTAYELNVYRVGDPFNCNIYKIAGNETDALVDIIESGSYYKVKLHNYDLYLTVGASTNGTNVYWDDSTSSNFQKWSFTEL